MGGVKLNPPVDEKISELARRTAALGLKFFTAGSGKVEADTMSARVEPPKTQPAELFKLADLMRYWNPGWQLDRAGFGGAGGGMGGIRGITCLAGDVLATYPRDEIRGLVLRHTEVLGDKPALHFDAGVDAGRAWELNVYAGNKLLLKKIIDGSGAKERLWQPIRIELHEFANRATHLRIYQRVLVANRTAGNAYWKNLGVEY
jgi:hypothetical protein